MTSVIFPIVSILLGLCTVVFAVQIVKTHLQIKLLRKQAGAFQALSRTTGLPSSDGSSHVSLDRLDTPSDAETFGETEVVLDSSSPQTVQRQPPAAGPTVTDGNFARIGQTAQQSAVYGRSIKLQQQNILEPRKRELTHA